MMTDKQRAAVTTILGLYREARFHPSCTPDMTRGDVMKTLVGPLLALGVTRAELECDPYKRRESHVKKHNK